MNLHALTLAVVVAIAAPACSTPTTGCDPRACVKGCCASDGTCQLGTTNDICGVSGQACVACPAKQHCDATAQACVANTGKPNVMLLLSRSGITASPIDPTNPSCPQGCGPSGTCPSTCPTRLDALHMVVPEFVEQNHLAYRFGLTAYPIDNVCGAPFFPTVQLPASDDDVDLRAAADTVVSKTQQLVAGGGQPGSIALGSLAFNTQLVDATRTNYVVWVVSSLPNCNPDNATTCASSACQCTISPNCNGQFCTLGCLDSLATGDSISDLKSKGVFTIVVLLGFDDPVFNDLATKGGFQRTCTSASMCTGGTCDGATGLCSKPYYRADSVDGLSAVFSEVGIRI